MRKDGKERMIGNEAREESGVESSGGKSNGEEEQKENKVRRRREKRNGVRDAEI